MAGSLALGNVSLSAYAEEDILENEEVYEEKDRLHVGEYAAPEMMVQANSNTINFIYEFAMEADKYHAVWEPYHKNLNNNQYTVINKDLNDGAGGYYIWLGYHYTNVFDKKTALITGLLIAKGSSMPGGNIDYNGKTYHPLDSNHLYNHSNGDFNQNAKGKYLVLYYTTDGYQDGDPVLMTDGFYVNGSAGSDCVSGYDVSSRAVNGSQDLNEGAGGDYIYLHAKYHTHTLTTVYDGAKHWKACTQCGYEEKEKGEAHELEYYRSSSDDNHYAICKNCGYRAENLSHIDADKNAYCDLCESHVNAVFSVNNIAFGQWENAWNYALNYGKDITLTTVSSKTLSSMQFEKTGKHTITLDSVNNSNLTLKDSSLIVSEGKVITNLDLRFENKSIEIKGGELETKSGNIRFVNNSNKQYNYAISVGSNASLTNSGASFTYENNCGVSGTAIGVSGSGSKVHMNGGSIYNFDHPIECNSGGDVLLRGGTLIQTLFSSNIQINGGTFKIEGATIQTDIKYNADKSDLKIESAYVRGNIYNQENRPATDILAPGVCVTKLDSLGAYTKKMEWESLHSASNIYCSDMTQIDTCKEHKLVNPTISSSSAHKGKCLYCNQEEVMSHNINDKGKCTDCGYQSTARIINNAGVSTFYDSLSDAIQAAHGQKDVKITLFDNSAESGIDLRENDDIHIDLNGKTLALSNGNTIELQKGSISIENGQMSVNVTAENIPGMKLSCENFSLKDVNIISMNRNMQIDGGNVTVSENSKLQFEKKAGILLEAGTLTISDKTKVISDDTCIRVAEKTEGSNASLNIDDGEIIGDNTAIRHEKGTIKLAKCSLESNHNATILCSGEQTLDQILSQGSYYYDSEGNLIDSELVHGKKELGGKIIVKEHDPHKGYTPNRDGKTHRIDCPDCGLKVDSEACIPDYSTMKCKVCKGDIICDHDFVDGICKICGHSAEAYVVFEGNSRKIYYYKLDEAIKAIQTSETKSVKLVIRTDVEPTQAVTVKNGVKITLESEKTTSESSLLSAEETCKVISSQSGPAVIVDGGELTIKDVSLSSGDSEALQIKGGKVKIYGGKFTGKDSSIKIEDGSEESETSNIGSLIDTEYYFAEVDSNSPLNVDRESSVIESDMQVLKHEDHTGYWENGVCSVCLYVCPHTTVADETCTLCGMFFGKHPITVEANISGTVNTKYFETLPEAVTFAEQGSEAVITLGKDIIPDNPGTVNISKGKITINFNEFYINHPLEINGKDADVILKATDSKGIVVSSGSAVILKSGNLSMEQCGALTEDTNSPAVSTMGGKLSIDGGTFDGGNALSLTDTTADIHSGLFTGTSDTDYDSCIYIEGATVKIKGGIFKMSKKTRSNTLLATNAEVMISGGVFEGNADSKSEFFSISSGRGAIIRLEEGYIIANADSKDVTAQYAPDNQITSVNETVFVVKSIMGGAHKNNVDKKNNDKSTANSGKSDNNRKTSTEKKTVNNGNTSKVQKEGKTAKTGDHGLEMYLYIAGISAGIVVMVALKRKRESFHSRTK